MTAIYEDTTFILTAMGMLGAGGLAVLRFVLKSRCEQISCCCLSCKRNVLTGSEMERVNVV